MTTIDYVNMIVRFNQETKAKEVWNFFKENGEHFKKLNRALSGVLAQNATMKACYYNCQTTLMRNPNLRYYEGFAFNIIPMDHAWLIDSHGQVVDPTWALISGWDKFKPDYFGIHIPREIVEADLLALERKPQIDLKFRYIIEVVEGRLVIPKMTA